MNIIYEKEIGSNKISSEGERPVVTYMLLSDGYIDNPQAFFAWEYFKSGKYVSVLDERPATFNDNDEEQEDIKQIWMYKVRVTYPSQEENEYDMMYGDDYNDEY